MTSELLETDTFQQAAWPDAFIALGSNLGDRERFLSQAVFMLRQHASIVVVACSRVYETPAHTLRADEVQPPYLNAVVHVRTGLTPEALLTVCRQVERIQGRVRPAGSRWQPRTLDMDLIVYGDVTMDTETLVLPHPRLADRRFVLQPLAELAPERVVPAPFAATVSDLLERCPDPGPLVPVAFVLDPVLNH